MLSPTPASLPWCPQYEYIHIDLSVSLVLLGLVLNAKTAHTWLPHVNFSSRTLIEITVSRFCMRNDQESVSSLTLCLSHIIIPNDIQCQPTLGQGALFFTPIVFCSCIQI